MVIIIMVVLTLLCGIPIILSLLGKMSWKSTVILVPVLLFLLHFGYYWIGQYVNILWFESLGYGQVFWTILGTQWGMFLVTFLICFAFYAINILLMMKDYRNVNSVYSPAFYVFAGVVALCQAIFMYSQWNIVLLNNNAVQFGVNDPIFNKDIGFYVFNLEYLRMIAGAFFFTVFSALIIVTVGHSALTYDSSQDFSIDSRNRKTHRGLYDSMIQHLCGLGVILIGVYIWLRFLGSYGYLFDQSGVVAGAGYADIARVGLNWWFIAFCVIAGIMMFVAFLVKSKGTAIASVSTILVMWVILMGIVPACIQSFVVKPNEFQVEQKYIDYNIQATRDAYSLSGFQEKDLEVKPLTIAVTEDNQPTLNNIRVWDWRAILDTYNQLQLFRTYYAFSDVDVDRYMINGQYRQVLISAREIDQSKLNEKTWINKHFVYTHGYGVTVNAVNEFTSKSEPIFLVGDIPPKSTVADINIKQPEIYFGKMTNTFAIVGAQMSEFNYPEGDSNNQNRYGGLDGIKLDTFAKRLAFSLYLDDLNILISEQISNNSKILWQRNIKSRIEQITPYLSLDPDDYLVIRDNGSLVWMQDAYTTSTMYPYSVRNDGINYVRNSAKIVVDAYNGTVDYYVSNSKDPIIQAYQKAFPSLFKSSMPNDLVKHLRYPETMFTIQTNVYSTYHMTDAKVFYNKEDVWATATEVFDTGEQKVIPYFVIATLPNSQSDDEFILMLPFTPLGRNNMIAWVGARCDGNNYGETLVYKFSKQQLVYGTLQVEAKINQKDEMASQFTLWSKSSTVIRGNTLVIPIGNSIIYTQPVYLKSVEAKMPQIVRVIAGSLIEDKGETDLKIEWGSNFKEALTKVMSNNEIVSSSVTPRSVDSNASSVVTIDQLLLELNDLKVKFNSLVDKFNAITK